MSPKTWRIGGTLAAALVLGLAWFLVISPTLDDAADLEQQTASQQQASRELRSRISLLKKQSEELPAQEAILADIQQRMPPTAALPTLIRNLTTVAKKSDVIVGSVTPGRPVPVETSQPAASSSASGSGSAPTASTSAAPAAGPSATTVRAMNLNIVACGSFAHLRKYLRELESMRRVATVSSVSISRGSCAKDSPEDDLTATIGAHVFTLPSTANTVAAVTSQQKSSSGSTKGKDDE